MDNSETNLAPPAGPFRRALTTRWRAILALGFLGSAALIALAYREFPAQYRAASLLRVDPSTTDLFNDRGNGEQVDQFLNTQVALITSANVLNAAGTSSRAALLPRIQGAGDVVLELRKAIRVVVVPGTFLIEVSMTGPSASEATTLVNAVVEAFIAAQAEWSDGMTQGRIRGLEDYLAGLKEQTDQLKRRRKDLAARGGGPARKVDDDLAKIGAKRLDNDLQRLDARSRLDALDQLVAEKKIAEGDAAPQRVELLTRVRAAEILQESLDAKADRLRNGASDDDPAAAQGARNALIGMQEQVQKRLEQLKFEARSEGRVRLVNEAIPPGRPLPNGWLWEAQVLAPVVAFLGAFGLVGAFEGLAGLRRSRPSDSDFGPI